MKAREEKLKKRELMRLNQAQEREDSNISAVLANEINKAKELEDMRRKASLVQALANKEE